MTNPKLRFKRSDGVSFPDWKERVLLTIFDVVKDRQQIVKNVLTIKQGIGTVPRSESGIDISAKQSSINGYKPVRKNDFIVHLRSFQSGFEIANSDGIVSAAYTMLRPSRDVSSVFFKNYFRLPAFVNKRLKIAVEGIRDGKSVNISQLNEVYVAIPVVDEQSKIADFFSVVDEKIDFAERKLSALCKLKAGLIQKIFSQEVRFKKEDGTDFPSWKKVSLASIADFVTVGIANAARHAYCDESSGIPMLRNMNIKPNRLDDSDVVYITKEFSENYPKKVLKKNDILVCRTGFPGTACVVPEKYDGAQTFTTLIVRLLFGNVPEYVCQYINSGLGKAYINSTTIGGGQKNSGAGIIEAMPIMLPEEEEQEKISAILLAFDKKIAIAEKELRCLQKLKQAFMQQMFV